MGLGVEGGERPVLIWFRDDLRLADNPALTEAARTGRSVVALYVLDEPSARRPLGGAARWWLHHSLAALRDDLASRGVPMVMMQGDAETVVPAVAQALDAGEIHWNRRYDPAARAVDAALKARFDAEGRRAASHNGYLLVEPWTVRTKSDQWFKVFSPFWRAARDHLGRLGPALPVPAMKPGEAPDIGVPLEVLALLPKSPDWAGGLREAWTPGEAGARAQLARFLDERIHRYADQRDNPGAEATSRLSPHLRFGEVSAATVHRAAEHHRHADPADETAVTKFQSELGWRTVQARFDAFPWRDETAATDEVAAWRAGRTGYPIVDAGMRELWQTGFMHNRVRMIVASFLVKHLLVDWRVGEAWFWDTLCDADPANNAASWQWVAGSGADAAPYFRVFNPVLQGERLDPRGEYVRRFVPELARVPDAAVHKPWTASPDFLRNFGVTLGRTYPRPIVDHDAARDRALAAFERLKSLAA
ncbi:MAG TPA: deoxyribodipyrimidine photo-lyase [Methylomirabilota bacterium]|nr:deoxyribodipyrimidine photo-lyase [Methylomirabilota bacterium]